MFVISVVERAQEFLRFLKPADVEQADDDHVITCPNCGTHITVEEDDGEIEA